MSYLVIAYPKLAPEDLEWIQNYRRQNDTRYYSVVDPHITLVFPVDNIDPKSLIKHVTDVIKDCKAFNLSLGAATINLDDSGGYYHEFLVPDIGNSDVIKLHDKLYTTLLAKHLRLDINFIPHIGIGNSSSAAESKNRADAINQHGIVINGRIDTITIVEYSDNVITPVKEISLT